MTNCIILTAYVFVSSTEYLKGAGYTLMVSITELLDTKIKNQMYTKCIKLVLFLTMGIKKIHKNKHDETVIIKIFIL